MTAAPDDLVTVSIPRSALTVVAPPPEFVNQNTADVMGLDRETYLRLCKRGAWPVTRAGRLRVARRVDVATYLEANARTLTPRPRTAACANDAPFSLDRDMPKGFVRSCPAKPQEPRSKKMGTSTSR